MAECKACGEWFGTATPQDLCPTCERALNRLGGYVGPVRRGRWVLKHRHTGGFHRYTGLDEMGEQHTIILDERAEYDDLYCSECGKQSADNFLNFCPNCGAKMDADG